MGFDTARVAGVRVRWWSASCSGLSPSRSPTKTVGQVGLFTNLRLVAVIAASLVLQLALHQIDWLIRLFQLPAMSFAERALPLLLGLIPVTALELAKLARARTPPPR